MTFPKHTERLLVTMRTLKSESFGFTWISHSALDECPFSVYAIFRLYRPPNQITGLVNLPISLRLCALIKWTGAVGVSIENFQYCHLKGSQRIVLVNASHHEEPLKFEIHSNCYKVDVNLLLFQFSNMVQHKVINKDRHCQISSRFKRLNCFYKWTLLSHRVFTLKWAECSCLCENPIIFIKHRTNKSFAYWSIFSWKYLELATWRVFILNALKYSIVWFQSKMNHFEECHWRRLNAI